jgi:hypothetical protein
MSVAVVRESQRRGHKAGPTDFWAKVKSLQADARQVQKMSPRALLVTLEKAPKAPPRAAGLVKEVGDLERAMQQIRRQLERAISSSAAANDGPEDTLQSMIAKGELLDPVAFAERLGWTRQALSKALASNRVFFVEHGRTRYYPAFYSDPRYERRQLEAVTKLLGDLPGGGKLQFFLNPRGSLSRATPLQALARGQLTAVKAAAEGFAQG